MGTACIYKKINKQKHIISRYNENSRSTSTCSVSPIKSKLIDINITNIDNIYTNIQQISHGAYGKI